MSGFRKYSSAVLKAMTDTAEQMRDDERLEEALRNHLFNLPGPKAIERRLSPAESVLRDVFSGFVEINKSFERLKDFRVYLKGPPRTWRRISRLAFVRYTIENYFNETYVLEQRLLPYSTRLYRRVSKRQNSSAGKTFDRVDKIVRRTLGPITKTRGSHVHRARYDDPDLNRLDILDLLVDHGGLRQLRSWYRSDLAQEKKWKSILRKNHRELKKLLDLYFAEIYPYVFGPKVQLVGKRRA